MAFINIEIKARTKKASAIREYLLRSGADFRGIDEQTDTYFNVPTGRLKLREGNIEKNLIFYNRPDQEGPKQSDFHLMAVTDANSLRSILTESLGIKVQVKKKREIYFIGNVKFHLDFLDTLGEFVEIEAGNKDQIEHPDRVGTLTGCVEELRQQCDFYMKELGIEEKDLVNVSYSDMLLTSK